MGVLAELEHEMDAVDLAGRDASDLRDLTRRVRTMRGLSERERVALGKSDKALARDLSETPPEMFAHELRGRIRQIREDLAGDGETGIERRRRESELVVKPSRDRPGMFGVWGHIDDERGTVLIDLVNVEARRLAGDGPVTANHRMAAMYNLITRSGDGPAPRMGVGWIADAVTGHTGPHAGSVVETWAGEPVDPVTIGRLACDADWYTTWLDAKGYPMWVSYQARTATREQRLALRALYPTCPIDGATAFADCEVHHLLAVDDGGETSIANLVPVSWTWHHRIHDRGWRLVMDPDRTLRLHRPDGTLERTIAPPTPITRHGP